MVDFITTDKYTTYLFRKDKTSQSILNKKSILSNFLTI